MDSLKKLLLVLPLITGCQAGYLLNSAYNQIKLLNSRVPIEEALNDPSLKENEKKKLELAQKVRLFAEQELHLSSNQNYSSFVKLDRPYVTYVVSAAYKWELKHFEWPYPFVGKMPYKGYFNEADAKEESNELAKQNLDTYMRGVSAYSTLGWFKDPLLSSMLTYTDYDLTNTIIHETVHATLYIKHAADFNERLATFLGGKGAEIYYLKTEGPNSPTLAEVKKDNQDDKLFSEFISAELKNLESWYKTLAPQERTEEKRTLRIAEIQRRFKEEIQPKMLTKNYLKFANVQLNNARLLIYKTYMQDLKDFEKLFEISNHDFVTFLDYCKKLQGEDHPEKTLKFLITSK